jgi:hypothetical protein
MSWLAPARDHRLIALARYPRQNGYYPYASDLEPHSVSKLYYRVSPAEWFERYMPIFGDLAMQIDGQERRALPWARWIITTLLDTSAHWQRVWRAVCCHQTQLPDHGKLAALSEQDHRQLWGLREYYRVFSLVNGGRREEHDLFEGLRPTNTAYSQERGPLTASIAR